MMYDSNYTMINAFFSCFNNILYPSLADRQKKPVLLSPRLITGT